jgi:hypothetical protein
MVLGRDTSSVFFESQGSPKIHQTKLLANVGFRARKREKMNLLWD